MLRKDASSNWHWMMQDGLGSVRAEVSNSIAVEGSQNFAPYGSAVDALGSFGTYGFTGEPTDVNGLVYDRARYYVPSIGMFASLDPFEGFEDEPMSINGYGYVHGNPVNWTDPTGEFIGALVPAVVACALNPLCAGAALLLTAAAILWLQSHPDEVNNAAKDAAKVINAGLCVINLPKLLPHILINPRTPQVVPYVETYPANQSPVSPITGYPNMSPIDPSAPLVFNPPVITTVPGGYPANSPFDTGPGSNILMASRPLPDAQPPGLGGSSIPYKQWELSDGGTIPAKNLYTRAGFELEAHSKRINGAQWAALAKLVTGKDMPTKAVDYNQIGQMVLDYIISNPNTQWIMRKAYTSGPSVEARLPNSNLGARWDDVNPPIFRAFLD